MYIPPLFPLIRGFALAALIGFLLTACSERLPTYRYRLTVEVETPEGLRTGSSVIEVRTHKNAAFPGPEAGTVAGSERGEAVAVDLGSRGMLFALLRSADGRTGAGGYAWALLPERPSPGHDVEGMRENYRALKAVSGTAELPADMYPMLVRFRDIADPNTVEEVSAGNLALVFGPGVRLRRVTVEITEDDVTEQIQERLPWLGASVTGYLDGQKTGGGPAPSNILDTTAFKRG